MIRNKEVQAGVSPPVLCWIQAGLQASKRLRLAWGIVEDAQGSRGDRPSALRSVRRQGWASFVAPVADRVIGAGAGAPIAVGSMANIQAVRHAFTHVALSVKCSLSTASAFGNQLVDPSCAPAVASRGLCRDAHKRAAAFSLHRGSTVNCCPRFTLSRRVATMGCFHSLARSLRSSSISERLSRRAVKPPIQVPSASANVNFIKRVYHRFLRFFNFFYLLCFQQFSGAVQNAMGTGRGGGVA